VRAAFLADALICERTRMINRLRWHLVTIAPDLETGLGQAALKGPRICARLARQLARLPQSPRLRVARRLLRRIIEIGREERQLLAELASLIDAHAPQLIAQPGCGTVTAAIIIGHTAGAQRFLTDGHFARHAGTAPIPASSGKDPSHRLHRGGDRQLNRAIHIIALSRARTDPETRATSPANKPRARPRSKPSAASNATSPAVSGACSTPRRTRPPLPC
jgi:transposase